METIVLKNKKKIDWKKIIIILVICAGIAFSVAFIGYFRIAYQYYETDIGNTVEVLGVSSQNDLIDRAFIEKIRETKKEGFQIVDYNLSTKIDKKIIITKKSRADEKTSINSKIKEKIYITVPAYKLTLDGKDYYFEKQKGTEVLYKLKNINPKLDIPFLEGVYKSKDNLTSQEEIDQLISNYSKQYKK